VVDKGLLTTTKDALDQNKARVGRGEVVAALSQAHDALTAAAIANAAILAGTPTGAAALADIVMEQKDQVRSVAVLGACPIVVPVPFAASHGCKGCRECLNVRVRLCAACVGECEIRVG
jgi:hypothetical protein